MDLEPWLLGRIQSCLNILRRGMDWGTYFAVVCFKIWKQRHWFIFQNKGLNLREVVLRSLCMAKGYFGSTNNTVGSNRLTDSVTEWSKTPCGAVKINTDGARADSGMMALAGGVIRDDKGEWILGFSQNIGVGTVLQSELLAIFDGLSIA
ncbi:hypothetical protein J1N35_021466 [Gossypium stocksii]|uniref:RNase H type-1 domain-containing protein n=1 Tax=Gossypium stocksii TaxID=47602 RepID=A0A9D3VEL8_9ROSI|nr:hypothetical protein J1N35_021466 [Gossypium stocksii]